MDVRRIALRFAAVSRLALNIVSNEIFLQTFEVAFNIFRVWVEAIERWSARHSARSVSCFRRLTGRRSLNSCIRR